MRPGRTPIVSFGPLNLALALVGLLAIECYFRGRQWLEARRDRRARDRR